MSEKSIMLAVPYTYENASKSSPMKLLGCLTADLSLFNPLVALFRLDFSHDFSSCGSTFLEHSENTAD